MNKKAKVLTIAGFDPCGGAGVLTDIRVMQALGVRGQAVCTAVTIQNAHNFKKINWVSLSDILAQIEILWQETNFKIVKIGLIENKDVLLKVLRKVKSLNRDVKIIWDPILSASAGFNFNQSYNDNLYEILSLIDLITPNFIESKKLGLDILLDDTIAQKNLPQTYYQSLSKVGVLIKGGHTKDHQAIDRLYKGYELKQELLSQRIPNGEKHGSGCVLSSAIATHWACSNDLLNACIHAKDYMSKYISSSKSLLGYY